jgi:hypothetical protein
VTQVRQPHLQEFSSNLKPHNRSSKENTKTDDLWKTSRSTTPEAGKRDGLTALQQSVVQLQQVNVRLGSERKIKRRRATPDARALRWTEGHENGSACHCRGERTGLASGAPNANRSKEKRHQRKRLDGKNLQRQRAAGEVLSGTGKHNLWPVRWGKSKPWWRRSNLMWKARAGRRDRQLHTEPSSEWACEPRPTREIPLAAETSPSTERNTQGFGVEDRAELCDTSNTNRNELKFPSRASRNQARQLTNKNDRKQKQILRTKNRLRQKRASKKP